MYGIDISSWQGDIDLTPYKNKFVIIRVLAGTKLDNKAKRNMDECTRLKIPFGVYCYSYALTVDQAKAEAKKMLEVIKGYNIRVGVWFDMEDADKYKEKHNFTFSKSHISAICNAFCEIIENAGYYAGIYANYSWFKNYINCPKYDKWVASWGTNNGKQNTNTSDMGSIQQYTSKPLDKDRMYVPLKTFEVKKKAATTTPETKPATTTPAKKEYYKVKKGDTLTAIAKKYKTTVKALAKLNPDIKNINVIYVGQKVRVK